MHSSSDAALAPATPAAKWRRHRHHRVSAIRQAGQAQDSTRKALGVARKVEYEVVTVINK